MYTPEMPLSMIVHLLQVVKLTWKRGDLAVWNNRKVLHTGTPSRAADKAASRLFHMTLLDCDAPLRPITV